MSQEQLFKISGESPISILFKLPGIRKFVAEYAFDSARVQQFLHRNDLHFDLVINEEFFQESFSMFAFKYKTPLVRISEQKLKILELLKKFFCLGTYGNSDFFDHQMGLITPWSHVPNLLLNYDDNMNFFERYHNIFVSIMDWLTRQYMHLPYQAEVANKYFADLAPLPSIDFLLKNVSLILVNTHRSVLPPRPAMPGIINVGGAHIKPAKPLPNDLKQFLDEAADGVIYFSLGTILKSSEMPQEKLNIFLQSFRLMKQRILWKYESETIVDIPSNVMIRKWLPQTDILAHKNVVLFITHGGMFGNFEAIARGVPLLVIPFFADQHRNAFRVVKMGYGKSMSFGDMTIESFNEVVQEIVTNNSYTNKIKEISAIYGDNLVHPLDEAMFWIEYVCRHRGAKHLKSHAVHMSTFQILLLDVILTTILGVAFIISLCFMLKRIVRSDHNKKQKLN